ncbi:hypothetical protein [Moorena producens]|uniref:hypothetical protein n=1 Tax=Moorena producens TaxID=1155739 RepID=UPI003C739BC7
MPVPQVRPDRECDRISAEAKLPERSVTHGQSRSVAVGSPWVVRYGADYPNPGYEPTN